MKEDMMLDIEKWSISISRIGKEKDERRFLCEPFGSTCWAEDASMLSKGSSIRIGQAMINRKCSRSSR